MAFSSLPVTPERAPSAPYARTSTRRSFTVPPKLATPVRKPQIGAAEDIETLCVVPKAKVVSFSTSRTRSPRPHSSSGQGHNLVAGTLAWHTPTERTLAAGPLEIYRVPGSVSFLHSGKLLHAILPRSQCWCVDGVSIFAFRVLPEQYYRMELPGETDEDKEHVEQLKVTLQKVLQYEKTACPFRRGFTVDLPETPEQPLRRPTRVSTEPAKRWTLDKVWRPEGWTPEDEQTPGTLRSRQGSVEIARSSDRSGTPSPSPHPQLSTAGHTPVPEPAMNEDEASSEEHSPLAPLPTIRPRALSNMRSVTAPSKLNLQPVPVENRLPTIDLDGAMHGTTDAQKADTIVEQFANMPLPSNTITVSEVLQGRYQDEDNRLDSAVLGVDAIDLPTSKEMQNEEDSKPPISAVTDTSDHHRFSEDDMVEHRMMSKQSTPSLSSDSDRHSWQDVVTPPETIRLRYPHKAVPQVVVAESPRSSPLSRPPARRTASHRAERQASAGLVRKTFTILTSPPSYLVNIMLEMAGRIANGALHLSIPSPQGASRRIPGSWDLSDDEEDDWARADPKGQELGVHVSSSEKTEARERDAG